MSWTEIDSEHCIALHHEFLRCEDALLDFERYKSEMILRTADRQLAYRAYNAYSRFIHHLYEFLIGATKREIALGQIQLDEKYAKDLIKDLRGRDADKFIQMEVNRVLKSCNYNEEVSSVFAEEFRNFRNKMGHVAHERAGMSLSDFYGRYHNYLFLLCRHAGQHWGVHSGREFPDLKEITDFSFTIKS